MVLHQFRQTLAETGPAQVVGPQPLMADHAKTTHVLGILLADMPDIVEERRQHHFIVMPFGQGQLRGLGHMLDLRDRLANVVMVAKTLVQAEDLGDRPLAVHQASSSNCAMLRSASAGPTLMPTPVCINAACTPGIACRNENGPGPRAP